jgi:hypothetical protein
MKRPRQTIALALLLLGCAHQPVPPPPIAELDPAAVFALVTHVLSDACTKRQTDEFLIAHTDFLLKACRGSVTQCVRKVCIKLNEEDEDPPPRP